MNNPIGSTVSENLPVSKLGRTRPASEIGQDPSVPSFCPHSPKILLLMDGLLDESRSSFIKKHIKTCDSCKERHELIKNSFSAISKNIPAGGMDSAVIEDIARELRELLKVVYQQAGLSGIKGKSLERALTFIRGIFTSPS